MTKNTKAEELLKVLGHRSQSPSPTPKTTVVSQQNSGSQPRRTAVSVKAKLEKSLLSVRGRKVDFYLHAEDERLIRELAVWLAPHRKRINDSLVVKAVLRAAKTGPGLLAAYDAAVLIDGRLKLQNDGRQGDE